MNDGEEGPDHVPKSASLVDIAAAEDIIRAVLTRRRRAGLPAPDPQKLADGIASLRQEYDVRRTMDSMATLKQLEAAYKQLVTAANSLHDAVEKIQKSSWAWYFLAILEHDPALSNDGKPDFAELNAAQALAGRLTGYAEVALKEVDASRGPERAERWYEHEERKAEYWLYGHGLPQLYEDVFRSAYSISGQMHDTRPSLRFAQAVLAVAGLPITGTANLRRHAKRAKMRREVLASDT